MIKGEDDTEKRKQQLQQQQRRMSQGQVQQPNTKKEVESMLIV